MSTINVSAQVDQVLLLLLQWCFGVVIGLEALAAARAYGAGAVTLAAAEVGVGAAAWVAREVTKNERP